MRLTAESFSTFRRAMLVLGMAGCLAIAGCSDGKIARNKIHGVVKVDGQPAGGVLVIFCPDGGTPEFQKARPMGLTQTDGTFFVNTFGGGDGAPAGQYKVLMSWAAPAKGGQTRDGGPAGGGDRLQGRYNNLEKTPFTVEVKSGTNELPPFELKSH